MFNKKLDFGFYLNEEDPSYFNAQMVNTEQDMKHMFGSLHHSSFFYQR